MYHAITATTSKEYFENLAIDDAIDRRFNQVILDPPTLDTTRIILKRRLKYHKSREDYVPEISDKTLIGILIPT